MNNTKKKIEELKKIIKDMKKVIVAFSGGVDSTFLLKIAYNVLGENVIAITAKSSTYPKRELNEAEEYTRELGIKHIIIESEELNIPGFSKNPTNRCYYCKEELFTKIKKIANESNIQYILDGSIFDDINDYRPGMKALSELGIKSPMKEVLITKDEIRKISKKMNIKTWNKQPFACLSSRFPYGTEITKEKLERIDKAEQYLLDLGFKNVRVRYHDNMARIEVAPDERKSFFKKNLTGKVSIKFKELGFTYVTLDLKGYRTGSMNETLKQEDKI